MDDFEAEMEGFEAEMAAFEREVEAEAEYHAVAVEREMAAHEHELEAFEHAMDEYDGEWATVAAVGRGGGGGLPPLGRWLLGLWAFGAGAVALGWLGATLAARRLVETARPETDDEWAVLAERARRLSGLDEPVLLLRTDALDVPIAWGYGRPTVVLPASADAWDDGRREAVLLHEMAHLRRRDAWTQAVAQVALALHWMNPLAWWGYRRFLDAREQACDDAVIQGGARPSDYAAHLVGVARALRRESVALAAVAPMARRAPIESRIVSILDGDRRRDRFGPLGLTATVALAAGLLLPLAALQPVARAQAPTDPPVLVPFAVEVTATPLDALPAFAPMPAVRDTDSVYVAPRHHDLDLPLHEIELAREEIRRALTEVERHDGEIARIRAGALREAEAALAAIDIEAIHAEARRSSLHAHREAARALAEIDWEEMREIQVESIREAQEALEEVDWEEMEELQGLALREAEKALEEIDWEEMREIQREALREAEEAREKARRAPRPQLRHTPRPGPPPAPQSATQPAPRPTPPPAPSTQALASTSCDSAPIGHARVSAVGLL